MDASLDIRKKIHDFIDHADERILRIFNAIIISEQVDEFDLSDERKAILDKRLNDHLENPNSGKSWSDVKRQLKKEYGV